MVSYVSSREKGCSQLLSFFFSSPGTCTFKMCYSSYVNLETLLQASSDVLFPWLFLIPAIGKKNLITKVFGKKELD